MGNRLEQLIVSLSGTGPESTAYLYDAANRLASVDGQAYTFDNNGNLLSSGTLTNSWDAANRLVESNRGDVSLAVPVQRPGRPGGPDCGSEHHPLCPGRAGLARSHLYRPGRSLFACT